MYPSHSIPPSLRPRLRLRPLFHHAPLPPLRPLLSERPHLDNCASSCGSAPHSTSPPATWQDINPPHRLLHGVPTCYHMEGLRSASNHLSLFVPFVLSHLSPSISPLLSVSPHPSLPPTPLPCTGFCTCPLRRLAVSCSLNVSFSLHCSFFTRTERCSGVRSGAVARAMASLDVAHSWGGWRSSRVEWRGQVVVARSDIPHSLTSLHRERQDFPHDQNCWIEHAFTLTLYCTWDLSANPTDTSRPTSSSLDALSLHAGLPSSKCRERLTLHSGNE